MRYSTDPKDPGYDAWQDAIISGALPAIYLDGVEQSDCVMADDATGEIKRCATDGDGRVQIHPDHPDEIWIETVTGHVEFRYD